jgi:hypothetical protein
MDMDCRRTDKRLQRGAADAEPGKRGQRKAVAGFAEPLHGRTAIAGGGALGKAGEDDLATGDSGVDTKGRATTQLQGTEVGATIDGTKPAPEIARG